jgi:hypothetical protein
LLLPGIEPQLLRRPAYSIVAMPVARFALPRIEFVCSNGTNSVKIPGPQGILVLLFLTTVRPLSRLQIRLSGTWDPL